MDTTVAHRTQLYKKTPPRPSPRKPNNIQPKLYSMDGAMVLSTSSYFALPIPPPSPSDSWLATAMKVCESTGISFVHDIWSAEPRKTFL